MGNKIVLFNGKQTLITTKGLTLGGKAIQLAGFSLTHIKNHSGESAKIDNLEIDDKSIHLLTNNFQ